jgi:phospholipid/cholesterol/gamma-HCH transport system substrate-binding protein/paraquat-inducible protein B
VRVICSVERKEDEKRVNAITEQQREVRIKEMIRKGLRLRLASNILTGQAYLEGVYLESKRFPILEISWEPKYLYVPSVPGTFSTMRDSVDKILEKLEEVDVKNMTEEIQGLFAELRQTNQNIQGLLASPDPNAESTNLAEILVKFDNTLDELNSKIKTEGPEVGKILRNVKVISDDIKELTATLKKHPSEILFSQPPAKSEIVK